MSNPSSVIVIVEDERHKRFIYKYLKKFRLERQARFELSPSGKGSAENWVRKTFAKEVGVYRKRNAQTALIVVIDADEHSVQDRLKQLDQALAENTKERVKPNIERIARIIPKRNIETWILCLHNRQIEEDKDYKQAQSDWDRLIPQAAEVLYQWTRPNAQLPQLCVDSLRTGVSELHNLKFV